MIEIIEIEPANVVAIFYVDLKLIQIYISCKLQKKKKNVTDEWRWLQRNAKQLKTFNFSVKLFQFHFILN